MKLWGVSRRPLPAWGAWALIVVVLAVRQLVLVHGLAHPGARVEAASFAGHTVGDLTCEALDHLGAGEGTLPKLQALGPDAPALGVGWRQASEPIPAPTWRRSARGPPQA
ncbi:hypothetical protein [Inhella gelatinilytica]|uniref:Uncharacterized protein n=1 Tax=Inhella gelatinilytica TaxID=2795030 RepID=A0A931IZW2_9BURK|nr:hypothetical protein [Inhella gelatinilytica]MBH9552998.1 hypothetical protein [Inhella gelatinilytica]